MDNSLWTCIFIYVCWIHIWYSNDYFNGKIAIIIYPVIYFVICFVYVILSFFDYIFKEKAIYLIIKNRKKGEIPKNSVQDDDELRKSDENENVVEKNGPNVRKEPEKPKEE